MHTHALRGAAGTIAAALVATLLAACGGNDYTASPAAPTIASFSATPATVPAGGGQVVLSWNALYASQLVIDNGVGDVSGSTSKTVNVSAGTTFTLSASNGVGTATAATVVAVAAQPAPAIASFTVTPATLPAGGGSVTLSWTTTDATTLSIDNGVGDVSGLTSKAVNVAANTTFALTATNLVGSANKTTSVSIGSAANLFVDIANGADTNPCTLAAPCRSLTKAMAGAPVGSTFSLGDGMYSATSEGRGGIGIPDGATIRAIHPGAATLASLAISVAGSATFDGVVIGREGPAVNCGGIGTSSLSGNATLTLIGVFSNCVNWLSVGGNVKATMTPGSLPGGAYTTGLAANATQWVRVDPLAELLIQGGVLDGNNTGNAYPQAGLLEVSATGKLTLDAVTVRNWPQAVLHTSGTAILRNGTLIDNVGSAGNTCDTDSAILVGGAAASLTMDHATLSNSAGAGICLLTNFSTTTMASVQLIQSVITKVAGAAIQGETNLDPRNLGATISADGASLTNNGWGIFWIGRPGTSIDLHNTTIAGSSATGSGAAVYLDMQLQPGSFKMRGSTISNNVKEGLWLISTLTADLGTATDPGGNTLTGNGLAGVHVGAFGGTTVVNAMGNVWTPSQQGADGNGRYSMPPSYAPVPKVGPASGVNFTIDNVLSTLNL